MARAIAQIISDLDAAYNPQRAAYQQQIDALPAYQQTQQAGLDQAKTNAFEGIDSTANSRGMFYSGQPLVNQAKYVGATYLPAVASLGQNISNQRFSLQNALAGLTTDEYKQAQGVQSDEQANDAKLAAAAIKGSSGGRSSSSKGSSTAYSGAQARGDYNSSLQNLVKAMTSHGKVPSYEDAVRQFVQTYSGYGISPQEIGETVYNAYASHGPRPKAKFYG
jgi:hypothetical protein